MYNLKPFFTIHFTCILKYTKPWYLNWFDCMRGRKEAAALCSRQCLTLWPENSLFEAHFSLNFIKSDHKIVRNGLQIRGKQHFWRGNSLTWSDVTACRGYQRGAPKKIWNCVTWKCIDLKLFLVQIPLTFTIQNYKPK